MKQHGLTLRTRQSPSAEAAELFFFSLNKQQHLEGAIVSVLTAMCPHGPNGPARHEIGEG